MIKYYYIMKFQVSLLYFINVIIFCAGVEQKNNIDISDEIDSELIKEIVSPSATELMLNSENISDTNLPWNTTENETFSLNFENSTEFEIINSTISNNTNRAPTNFFDTVFQQTKLWFSELYTLEVMIPIVIGLTIATFIIFVLATCRCMRRRYYRRRLRRKILPEDVKNLRPSDRSRLLAETSDEEF